MNLDPRTIIIMNIIGTLLMSLSLFAISRGHLAQIQGVKRWSAATLVQSIGWLVVGALRGILPDFISIVVGNALLLLSIAFYFNIIAEFKNKLIPTFWAFSLVGFEAILLSYFLLVTPNAAARIVIISSCTSVLMLMGGYYLLFERGKRPISHTLTGSMFALCGVLLAVRCIYSLVWDTVPNQLPFGYHPLGSINYLTFFITSIMLTFGFVLMCNDKYIIDRKQR
jgi:hypothetical protein